MSFESQKTKNQCSCSMHIKTMAILVSTKALVSISLKRQVLVTPQSIFASSMKLKQVNALTLSKKVSCTVIDMRALMPCP